MQLLPTETLEDEAALSVRASAGEDHFTQNIKSQRETSLLKPTKDSVLYLAYGSNLASATFLGMRGIKPLSQISVLVPELRLTFDMPGVPYIEPCFAGTRARTASEGKLSYVGSDDQDYEFISTHEDPEIGLLQQSIWSKPLVGVVYEVTFADYAKIIATEGGGRGYQDVQVDCYPFAEDYKPTDPVPDKPHTKFFKAHTLLSPYEDSPSTQAIKQRSNPNCSQPSLRYINLIMTGAQEHNFPVSYQDFLAGIHTYHITTTRQKVGRALFLTLWGPMLFFLLTMSKLMAGPDGRSAAWLITLTSLFMDTMWASYHYFFKPIFGSGTRTTGDSLRLY